MSNTNKLEIIAEIGVNHNGIIDLAREMIDTAANAGVDFVKFQTSIPSMVTSKYAPKDVLCKILMQTENIIENPSKKFIKKISELKNLSSCF